MLINFKVSNYKMYKGESIFSMEGTSVKELPTNLFVVNKKKLVKSSVIYGFNSSGKSGLISAFKFFFYYTLRSFGEYKANRTDRLVKITPFLLDEISKELPTKFEASFYTHLEKKQFYTYRFSIKNNLILQEELKVTKNKKEIILFKRIEKDIEVSSELKEADKYKNDVHEKVLFLSHLFNTDISTYLNDLHEWFEKVETIDFGHALFEHFRNSRLTSEIEEQNYREKMINFISKVDKGIVGIEIEKIKSYDDDGKEKENIQLFAIHNKILKNGEKVRVRIPFQAESSGTIKVFGLYSDLIFAIENGSLLIIDELDAKLHPNLTRAIVELFNSEDNANGAQLIFTTHDTSLLTNELFRRDQIWFAQKNDSGESELIPLSELRDEKGNKIRSDASYGKNYLAGNYVKCNIEKF